VSQAVKDIADALGRLKEARQNNDFAAEGQALADLDKAAAAYESAQRSAGGGSNGQPSSSAPPSGGG
jgi:hypothetical protein